jgi:hypothetical protein
MVDKPLDVYSNVILEKLDFDAEANCFMYIDRLHF